MTNVVAATTTEVLKTVKLDWTSSQIVRITTNVDMPEYGVKARQTVYLIRSSANDGTYYLVIWGDRKASGWSCSCVGNQVYGKCRHCVLANAHSRNRAKRIAIQKAAQEQQKKDRWVKYNLSSFFEALYVHSLQQVVRPEPAQIQIMAVNKEIASPVKVALKPRRYCTNCTCALPLQVVNAQHVCAVCAVCAGHTRENAPLQGRGFRLENGIPMR